MVYPVSDLNKSLPFVVGRRPRIGLLGGSFNPAHIGHLHISRLALKLLSLDELWWLVSPQNPLKGTNDMASVNERLLGARSLIKGRKIWPTNLESTFGTNYTIDTISTLKNKFPQARFVWLIGADNLSQISSWKKWSSIFETVPVAVFARPNYALQALNSIAAKRFSKQRINQYQATALADLKPPVWTYLKTPMSFISATSIRNSN